MSGTPEKILEHFLETIRLEPALNEATGKHVEELWPLNLGRVLWKKKKHSEFILSSVSTAVLEMGHVWDH